MNCTLIIPRYLRKESRYLLIGVLLLCVSCVGNNAFVGQNWEVSKYANSFSTHFWSPTDSEIGHIHAKLETLCRNNPSYVKFKESSDLRDFKFVYWGDIVGGARVIKAIGSPRSSDFNLGRHSNDEGLVLPPSGSRIIELILSTDGEQLISFNRIDVEI